MSIKLLSWNCRGGLATKIGCVLDMNPDVAVICESSDRLPPVLRARTISWTAKAPNGDRKHIGVLAREPWRAAAHDLADHAPPWCLPVSIDGPTPFTVLAVWPVAVSGWGTYTSQLRTIAEDWVPRLRGPVVLAGDLNTPIASSLRQFCATVNVLTAAGLTSVYLASRGLSAEDAYGSPERLAAQAATFRDHRGTQHLDHVFAPTDWAPRSSLCIGSLDEWVDTGLSDHVPLAVTVSV